MNVLTPGILVLDKDQSVREAEVVERLLDAGVEAGPDGHVIMRGWLWRWNPLVVVCVTCDN